MRPKASGPAALIPVISADRTLLEKAGFTDIFGHDVTDNVAPVVSLCQTARAHHADADAFASFHEFLAGVAALATDGRHSRLAFVARRAVAGANPHYPNQDGSTPC